jgi:hypothetical protein
MYLKHGLWKHPLYATWTNMMRRCGNPQDRSWPQYGGRGITVCERWHDVVTFVADMTPGHAPGLELDRIDNSLGYSPENCRWLSRDENRNNMRRQTMVTIDGVTKTSAQWARENGIDREVARCRIKVRGWDPVLAVTLPPLPRHEVISRASKASKAAAKRRATLESNSLGSSR